MSVFIEDELEEGVFPEKYTGIIEEIVSAACEYAECPFECEVNVLITDNEGIHAINSEQRGIDAPTDVLSFPMIEYEEAGDFSVISEDDEWLFDPENGELILGDIVLNYDRIKAQAEEFNHSVAREVAFLTAHSMLHLFGYDHVEDEERKDMERMQEEIISKRGYTRDYEEE